MRVRSRGIKTLLKSTSFLSEMDVLAIPEVPLETLFTMFSGQTLLNCRLVNKNWNEFVKYLWSRDKIVEKFQFTLSQNWRFPLYRRIPMGVPRMKYEVTTDFVTIPIDGYIGTVSSNMIAVRTWNEFPIDEARVSVFNVVSSEWWNVPNVTQDIPGHADYDDFILKLTDKIIAIRVPLIGETPRSFVRVWSLESRRMIYQRVLNNVHTMFVNKFEDPHLMFVFAKDIMVFNFRDEDLPIISTFESIHSQFSFGSYNKPFIVQNLYQGLLENKSVNIYKYNDVTGQIVFHLSVPFLEKFVKFPSCDGYVVEIVRTIFYEECFLLCAKMVINDYDYYDGHASYFTLVLLVVNEAGNLVKHRILFDYEAESIVKFYFYNELLFIQLDEDVYVYEKTLTTLCKATRVDELIPFKLNRVMDLLGDRNLMISKRQARNVLMNLDDQGNAGLSIRKLEFWKIST